MSLEQIFDWEEYQAIETYLKSPSYFEIIDKNRNENIHSSFLAWLFDPDGEHGLGSDALTRLLQLVTPRAQEQVTCNFPPALLNQPIIEGIQDVTVRTESPTLGVRGERGRLDIAVDFLIGDQHYRMVVENKIYADEGVRMFADGDETREVRQTSLYVLNELASEEVRSQETGYNTQLIFIFLTPNGACASSPSFVNVTYQDLLDNVLMPVRESLRGQRAKTLVDEYVRSLDTPARAVQYEVKADIERIPLAISIGNREERSRLIARINDTYGNIIPQLDVSDQSLRGLAPVLYSCLPRPELSIPDGRIEAKTRAALRVRLNGNPPSDGLRGLRQRLIIQAREEGNERCSEILEDRLISEARSHYKFNYSRYDGDQTTICIYLQSCGRIDLNFKVRTGRKFDGHAADLAKDFLRHLTRHPDDSERYDFLLDSWLVYDLERNEFVEDEERYWDRNENPEDGVDPIPGSGAIPKPNNIAQTRATPETILDLQSELGELICDSGYFGSAGAVGLLGSKDPSHHHDRQLRVMPSEPEDVLGILGGLIRALDDWLDGRREAPDAI